MNCCFDLICFIESDIIIYFKFVFGECVSVLFCWLLIVDGISIWLVFVVVIVIFVVVGEFEGMVEERMKGGCIGNDDIEVELEKVVELDVLFELWVWIVFGVDLVISFDFFYVDSDVFEIEDVNEVELGL